MSTLYHERLGLFSTKCVAELRCAACDTIVATEHAALYSFFKELQLTVVQLVDAARNAAATRADEELIELLDQCKAAEITIAQLELKPKPKEG